jgi:hypothetical protein
VKLLHSNRTLCPAQNISEKISTRISLLLCHLMHSLVDSIDTVPVLNKFVPVCPILGEVLPHPAIIPFLFSYKSTGCLGRQIGNMWALKIRNEINNLWTWTCKFFKETHLYPAGFTSFNNAISYRSGWVIRNLNRGWIILWETRCFSAGNGSIILPEFWVSNSPR